MEGVLAELIDLPSLEDKTSVSWGSKLSNSSVSIIAEAHVLGTGNGRDAHHDQQGPLLGEEWELHGDQNTTDTRPIL